MEKLRGKGIVEKDGPSEKGHSEPAAQKDVSHAMQLPVDVFQADREIIIYAQMAGIDMATLDVSITGENDVITIQGRMHRPEDVIGEMSHDGDYTLEECHWGEFYRQIILPEEIDPEGAEAKTKDGVLILRLPLKGMGGHGLKLNVVRLDSHS